MSNIEEMVASVKAHGIIEPITVVALDDGRYQIVTGHRRYRAAKLAALGQVEILVRQPEDDQRRQYLMQWKCISRISTQMVSSRRTRSSQPAFNASSQGHPFERPAHHRPQVGR